jgi:phosphate transport system permease protein
MSREWVQRAGFAFLTLVTVMVVLPIILVVGYIIAQGAPALSWEFLSQMPRGGMREGGILPAMVGTLAHRWHAAVFRAARRGDGDLWPSTLPTTPSAPRATGHHQSSGIPSVVYGLFGLGCLCCFCALAARSSPER